MRIKLDYIHGTCKAVAFQACKRERREGDHVKKTLLALFIDNLWLNYTKYTSGCRFLLHFGYPFKKRFACQMRIKLDYIHGTCKAVAFQACKRERREGDHVKKTLLALFIDNLWLNYTKYTSGCRFTKPS